MRLGTRSRARVERRVVLAFLLVLAVAPTAAAGVASGETGARRDPVLPTAGTVDYQLGTAYDAPAGTSIVARDSTAQPAGSDFDLCYVNGFQTQPGQRRTWPRRALLRRHGRVVTDPGWPDEVLLDTRTRASRAAIVRRLRRDIDRCASAGFDGVELDNLDSWTRSHHLLRRSGNLALATALVREAHRVGLPAGQKNAVELGTLGRDRVGFTFAVAEECVHYDECSGYTRVYGADVIDIEYTDELSGSAADVCSAVGRPSHTVVRDRELVGPGQPGYFLHACTTD